MIRGDRMNADSAVPEAADLAVRFIRDTPADDDFFSTHTRVAAAIVRAINENPEIKVIGLLGRWGSGKSTVANKVVELLEERRAKGFRVFTYDAWLHQSDPLRRSFLESLIRALVKAEPSAIAENKWTRELDRLSNPVEDTRTIETPTLTFDGIVLAASLVAVPFGIGLIDLEMLKDALGKTTTSVGVGLLWLAMILIFAPLWSWLGLYIFRRRWLRLLDRKEGLFTPKFFTFRDVHGQPAHALKIFEDGQARHSTTRTFRATEPTSLEFGRVFQEIMREAADGGHRLVILIDNLDRVAEEEALGMWATIRSFFLASHETEDVTYESFHPTVILPIDRHAVEALFAGSDENGVRVDARDRARSFMDKTFDVTFEVTEPVHSDWRDFLDHQMRWMFQAAYQPSWGFWTRRLFESELARQQAATGVKIGRPPAIVTPREINKLLNRVGALYLQWAEAGIPIEVMALYVIRRDDIDRSLISFLQSSDMDIAEVAPDWKRQLAALYYGVDPEKAGQVLLAEPIRVAIVNGDVAALRSLATIPGFGEQFDYATDNLPEPPSSVTPFGVLSNAIILLEAVKVGSEWTVKAWRNLLSGYRLLVNDATPTADALKIVQLLSPHVPEDERGAFVEQSAGLISRILSQPRRANDGVPQAALGLVNFAKTAEVALPEFDLDVDAPTFLARLSGLADWNSVWPRLRTGYDGEELGAALEEMLSGSLAQRNVPNAVLRLAGDGGADLYDSDTMIDFGVIARKADEVTRSPVDGGDGVAGIRTLARLARHREDSPGYLVALVDEGILSKRLNEAVARSAWEAVADLIAILLWRGQKFSSPSEMSWSSYAERDPVHLRRIVSSIARFFPNQQVSILWKARRANVLYASFFESIIGHAVETNTLGSFDPKPVLADLLGYKLAVPSKQRDKFLEAVDQRVNLLSTVESGPLDPHAVEAAKYLRRKGGESARRADTALRAAVEQSDVARWTRALKSGDEPLNMALAFNKSEGLRLGARSGLSEALKATATTMATSANREFRGRWFKLVTVLKPKEGRAALRVLGEALETASSSQALHVLKAGGVEFLKAGGFALRADQSVRKIIIPQLGKKEGRDWLRDNRDEMVAWVQKSDAKAQAELLKALNTGLRSKQEDRSYTANMLAAKWGFETSHG